MKKAEERKKGKRERKAAIATQGLPRPIYLIVQKYIKKKSSPKQSLSKEIEHFEPLGAGRLSKQTALLKNDILITPLFQKMTVLTTALPQSPNQNS